ncbi:hypothetical protein [Undibacterium sp.]|jgi:hypothetical protein|uniref:hypothetical protein n=1 Tax=Undibacterium sp. TaxID=1914977 RepID=UPI002CD88AC0|nr:hypothetical protein [Undibacterium sp.]HTD05223.1 hypothetical protein [Undibacterium sp.]
MDDWKKLLSPAPFVEWANHGLTPPEGYDSFLAYAIAGMDTRALELHGLIADSNDSPSREDFSKEVAAEYAALCKKAGVS